MSSEGIQWGDALPQRAPRPRRVPAAQQAPEPVHAAQPPAADEPERHARNDAAEDGGEARPLKRPKSQDTANEGEDGAGPSAAPQAVIGKAAWKEGEVMNFECASGSVVVGKNGELVLKAGEGRLSSD